MAKEKILKFEAIKYKYVDDSDGEATIIFKVSMRDKLSAFAIPIQKRLELTAKVING